MESAKSRAKLAPSTRSQKVFMGGFGSALTHLLFAWLPCPGGVDLGLPASQGRRTDPG